MHIPFLYSPSEHKDRGPLSADICFQRETWSKKILDGQVMSKWTFLIYKITHKIMYKIALGFTRRMYLLCYEQEMIHRHWDILAVSFYNDQSGSA